MAKQIQHQVSSVLSSLIFPIIRVEQPSFSKAQIFSSRFSVASLLTIGVAIGASLTYWIQYRPEAWCLGTSIDAGNKQNKNHEDSLLCEARKRERLPYLVILVRHGESEGNIDMKMWWKKPDNQIQLTIKGMEQAKIAGQRIEKIFQHYEHHLNIPINRVHIHASPFERTIQTARCARKYFEHRVVRQNLCPRLREQEFGNTQSSDFKAYREEQKRVGRFYYRFPTGESGSDVFDRVKSWWEDSLLSTNERYGYEPIDAVVVFSHGLTMRFCLMQLFSWSPTTFHSVYNVKNCGMYVLKKDLTKPGSSPYVLDAENGDAPESSIDILVTYRSNSKGQNGSGTSGVTVWEGNRSDGQDWKIEMSRQETETSNQKDTIKKTFTLRDYLSIPPPRMTHIDAVKLKLLEQYPNDIGRIEDIVSITFMPFYHAADAANDDVTTSPHIIPQGRTSLTVENEEEVRKHQSPFLNQSIGTNGKSTSKQKHAIPECSHRWPICYK